MAQTNGNSQRVPADVDEALLSILACPACLQAVERRGAALVCAQCGRRYPIKDGIPIMLIDEALPPEQGAPDSG